MNPIRILLTGLVSVLCLLLSAGLCAVAADEELIVPSPEIHGGHRDMDDWEDMDDFGDMDRVWGEEWEHNLKEYVTDLERKAGLIYTDEVERFLTTELPEAVTRLEQMKSWAEDSLEEQMALFEYAIHAAENARHLHDMKRHDPKQYEVVLKHERLELQAENLSEQYQEAETAETKEKIRTELRKVLSQGFVLSQDMRRREAEMIEKEVREIRQLLETREQNKKLIIDRRLHELVDGIDPFEW